MTGSGDLSDLFGTPSGGVRFGQGLIAEWDPLTGENTVEWAGGTLTNVPVLNTGEAVALKAGHVVGMLGQGLTWFIIGRITPANDPSFAGASVAFAASSAQAQNFAITASLVTKASTTLDVPAWADEAAVFLTSSWTIVNTTGTANFASAAVRIDGTYGPANVQQGLAATGDAGNGHMGNLSVSSSRVFAPAGSTILCEAQVRSNSGSWTASASNNVGVSAVAIFRSTT